jgi:hypothetical protein
VTPARAELTLGLTDTTKVIPGAGGAHVNVIEVEDVKPLLLDPPLERLAQEDVVQDVEHLPRLL